MPNPDAETIDRMHRWFAVECNNHGWNLTTLSERSESQEREMLQCAYAAAWHWAAGGEPINDARADMLLAHAHALLGHGPMALQYAQRCLTYCEHQPCEAWDLAFAHAELGLAAGVAGKPELSEPHLEQAQRRGEEIPGEEDRRIFGLELRRILDYLGRGGL